MTSTTNREGRGEIEAAKHLLALSKKVATFASEAALAARRELRAARTEEGEAESSLKRAKERWKVVEVDAEDDEAPSKAASGGGGKGSGEIAAAKQRVALAKRWERSSAKAFESAVSRLGNAQKKLKAAEEFLKAVEKRLGVVELDLEDEDEGELDGGSSARRKREDDARKRPRPTSLPSHSNDSVIARGPEDAQVYNNRPAQYQVNNGMGAAQGGGGYQHYYVSNGHAPATLGAAHANNNYSANAMHTLQQLPLPPPQQQLPYPQNQGMGNVAPPHPQLMQQMPFPFPPQNTSMNDFLSQFNAPNGPWAWNWNW